MHIVAAREVSGPTDSPSESVVTLAWSSHQLHSSSPTTMIHVQQALTTVQLHGRGLEASIFALHLEQPMQIGFYDGPFDGGRSCGGGASYSTPPRPQLTSESLT